MHFFQIAHQQQAITERIDTAGNSSTGFEDCRIGWRLNHQTVFSSAGGLQTVVNVSTGFLDIQWADVAGESLARITRPVKIGYGREGMGATLTLLVKSSEAPMVQMALPVGAGPADVYALGAALRGLRSQGVLVVGSGSMTHNLAEFFGGERAPAPYVLEFSRWIEDALARGDMAALLNYRTQAPHASRAHPTEDHFLPIFFALGAAGDDLHANYLSREVMYSMLSMDAFALEPVH